MVSSARSYPPPITPAPQARHGNLNCSIGQLDFGVIDPGDVVKVQTSNSVWYFTRISWGAVTRDQVIGVFVQTNSRRFGQITRSPSDVKLHRMVEVGQPILEDGRQMTGVVERIWLNAHPV